LIHGHDVVDSGGEIFDEGSEAVQGQVVTGAFASGFAADGSVRRGVAAMEPRSTWAAGLS
jgi:hypothetical protein